MKILMILILFCIASAEGSLQSRLTNIKNYNNHLLTQMPLIPVDTTKEVVKAFHPLERQAIRGLTRVEVNQEYMADDIKDLKAKYDELDKLMDQTVTAMEVQTKVAEATQNKSERNDLILKIVGGIVGFLVSGLAWKNKHLVIRSKKES